MSYSWSAIAPMTGDIPVSTALNDRANFRYSCSIREDENRVGDKKLSQFVKKRGFFFEISTCIYLRVFSAFFTRKTYIKLSLILPL
jgi:hypothetical protein